MSRRIVKIKQEIRMECRDCGKGFSTASKFSDHAHICPKNPVNWSVTADYIESLNPKKEVYFGL